MKSETFQVSFMHQWSYIELRDSTVFASNVFLYQVHCHKPSDLVSFLVETWCSIKRDGHSNQSQLNQTWFILWSVHRNMKYCMKWQFIALNTIFTAIVSKLKAQRSLDGCSLYTNKNFRSILLNQQLHFHYQPFNCNTPLQVALRG